MKIEEMFKDEKSILNLEYLSYVERSEILGRWLLVFLLVLFNLYLISRVKIDEHRVKLAKRESEKKKINFIRYAISLAVDIYSMVIKVSKTGRLVLLLEGIKK